MTPLVSIGMPAFNEAGTISRAIEAILSQTFSSFELTVFDDRSTDDTAAIAEAYALKDTRLRVLRNSCNLGVVANLNRALSSGSGAFVMPASANDWIEPTFLEGCMAIHEREPGTALVYVDAEMRDASGRPAGRYAEHSLFETPAADPFTGACIVMRRYGFAAPMWGIYRRSVLQAMSPYPYGRGCDHVFICETALHGSIRRVPEVLYNRSFPFDRGYFDIARQYSRAFPRGLPVDDIFARPEPRFPMIDLLYQHLDMFAVARIDPQLRPRLFEAAQSILTERYEQELGQDLRALEQVLETALTRMGQDVRHRETLPDRYGIANLVEVATRAEAALGQRLPMGRVRRHRAQLLDLLQGAGRLDMGPNSGDHGKTW